MLVGIGYKMDTGKDTAATALCRDLGFRRLAFADQLKLLALEADVLITPGSAVNTGIGRGRLAWIVKSVGWEVAKRDFPEARIFLQNLGLGARRVFGENFWIDQVLDTYHGDPDRLVVPDVRFLNEFEAVRAAGGKLIKLRRTSRGHGLGHRGETELDALPDEEWDAVVDNYTDVAAFQAKIVDLTRSWMPKEKTGASSIFDPDGES